MQNGDQPLTLSMLRAELAQTMKALLTEVEESDNRLLFAIRTEVLEAEHRLMERLREMQTGPPGAFLP